MNPFKGSYPVILEQNVLWGDMDAFEHVNNKVYFRYFEDARITYFERLGFADCKAELNQGPILASTSCDFKLPLTFPDRIHIAARCEVLSPKKFKMEYAVYSQQFDAIAATGEGLIVYYDYTSNKSCEIPESVLQALNELEKN